MKNQRLRQLASLLIVSEIMFVFLPGRASAVTQSEIDDLQHQVDLLGEEREQSQTRIDELLAEQTSVLEQKAVLDQQSSSTRRRIQLIADQIDLYREMLQDKEKEVEQARQEEQEHLQRYRARIRAMEENSSFSLLDILLHSSSLLDVLSVGDDIGEIMDSDKKLMEDYIAARQECQAALNSLEETKGKLESKQDELLQEQADLQAELDQADALIQALERDLSSAAADYALRAAEEEKLDAYVNELSRQYLADKRRALKYASAPPNLMWPAPSCKLLTSRFGYRMHPIFNYERFHAGVDIGAQYGSEIVAAEDGVVLIAEYSDSYGNYVVLDHGGGYTTLYAHMCEIAVDVSQEITQGDILGYVGSTGWSTGPHLHFEVRVNGEKTDPASYFDGLSYYNC